MISIMFFQHDDGIFAGFLNNAYQKGHSIRFFPGIFCTGFQQFTDHNKLLQQPGGLCKKLYKQSQAENAL